MSKIKRDPLIGAALAAMRNASVWLSLIDSQLDGDGTLNISDARKIKQQLKKAVNDLDMASKAISASQTGSRY